MNDEEFDEMMDWYDAAIASGQGFKSEEEKKAYFDSLGDPFAHPMFAASTEELEGNPLVEAFRLLREEDKTFSELANMYKDEGNEWIKKGTTKDYHEAIARYDHALTHLEKAYAARRDGTEEEKEKSVDYDDIKSNILNNRALANLNLKNFRKAIEDCDAVLQIHPKNIKALYRKCKSLVSVNRFDEGLKVAQYALEIEPTNSDLIKLQQKSFENIIRINKQAIELEVRLKRKEDKWIEAWNIATRRTVKIAQPASTWNPPPQLKEYVPHLAKNVNYAVDGSECWPATFLYPQYKQLDVVEGLNCSTMLVEQLSVMFPHPDDCSPDERPRWDRNNEYLLENLVVYLLVKSSSHVFANQEEWLAWNRFIHDKSKYREPSQKPERYDTELIEVHMGCTFLQILTAPHHAIEGGVLSLLVFPRGNKPHQAFLRAYNAGTPRLLNPQGKIVSQG